MPKLKDIVAFLDEYLKINDIADGSWNGLQFEGSPDQDIKKAAFAVDANIETFRKAAEEHADLIVVHHGHFWKSANPSFTGWNKERLDILYKNGISLYAAHLPLDRHKEAGNAAELLRLLGAKITKEEFLEPDGKNVGWTGELKQPLTVREVERKLNSGLNTKCTVLPFGKEKIKTIAVCSGGGGYSRFFGILDKNIDLYLTGDAIEIYSAAKDAKMNVIFAGHHATETVGLKALSEIVAKKFGVKTIFIDVPTGL